MKCFSCKDVGVNCSWTGTGKDNEELLRKIEEHVRNTHNMTQIPEDLIKKVIANIRDVKAA